MVIDPFPISLVKHCVEQIVGAPVKNTVWFLGTWSFVRVVLLKSLGIHNIVPFTKPGLLVNGTGQVGGQVGLLFGGLLSILC